MLAVVPVALKNGAGFDRFAINFDPFFRAVIEVIGDRGLGDTKIITGDERELDLATDDGVKILGWGDQFDPWGVVRSDL